MGIWDSVKRFFGGGKPPPEDEDDAPASDGAPPPAAAAGGPYRGGATRAQPQAHRPNPYAGSPVMGMSVDEVRQRFLELRAGRIATTFLPEMIPPAHEELTQLVDRSIVLAGLLTQKELVEIHDTGEEWRKHRNAEHYAAIVARVEADDAVKEVRRRRAENRRQKRAEAQARREARRAAIVERRKSDILHAGAGVSGQLAQHDSDLGRLASLGLPPMSTPAELATALGIDVGALRWLCFHQPAARVVHYRQFVVPKRSGGERVLSAPLPHLKRTQHWILRNILDPVPLEAPAHGFVRGRSTVSNAREHLRRDVVVNLDLADFFPSVTFPRVRGVFRALGYSPAAASLLALLSTECPRRPMLYAGTRYHVAVGDRALPQGAPTSPALANLASRRLDRRLAGLAAKAGWTYTRYADDLTFSAPRGKRGEVARLLAAIRHIVEDEGFRINDKKGRVQRCGRRQDVTGIVVNDKPGLPRAEVRRLRAILHRARTTGLEAQNKTGIPHFAAWLEGKLAYLAMVDRDKGMAMLAELRRLK
jgi:RNA-directed DNA polymerase